MTELRARTDAAQVAVTKIRQLAAESMGRAFNTTTDDVALLAIVQAAQNASPPPSPAHDLRELQAEVERLTAACAAYRSLIETEFNWEDFRSEFSSDGTASANNCRRLDAWLLANSVENVGDNFLNRLAAAESEAARLRSQLAGVQGALADAGDVLCFREDGNYGASVREVVEQRDRLRAELEAMAEQRDVFMARCADLQERMAAPQYGSVASDNTKPPSGQE